MKPILLPEEDTDAGRMALVVYSLLSLIFGIVLGGVALTWWFWYAS